MDKGFTDGSTSLEEVIDEGFLRWCLKEEKCPCPLNHVGLLKRNLCILDIFFFLTEYRERRERERTGNKKRQRVQESKREKEERKKKVRVKNREGGGKREKEKFLMTVMDL